MSSGAVKTAVVLARGLGTRMRREADGAVLDAQQAAVAATGLKAMIPVGRPFLDFVISGLADAGFSDVCLVIGPEHDSVRQRYAEELPPSRVRLRFAVQEQPLGTADAVLAAQEATGGEPFVVLNSDNYYPVEALAALRGEGAPSLLGFDRAGLVRGGNIDPRRIASFALLVADAEGVLQRVMEKPAESDVDRLGPHALVSMNCWCFPPDIFAACRAIGPSARGELEIPTAVQYAIEAMGMRFRIVPSHLSVLDLSSRGDIAAVKEHLRGVEVSL